ncbi:helix-turn-helix domain-containing protein [Corallincola platygyrae]|uniref:Helix-turn-helix domain-containing protein n=1 Tax=Corallincola platygyrae TaxID=1193278 RepID=A0ABW4XQZ0_9GAMM
MTYWKNDPCLSLLAQHGREVSYRRGQLLYDIDTVATHLFLVTDGSFELCVPYEGTLGTILDMAAPGSLAAEGEYFLQCQGEIRHTTIARAREPSCAIAIPYSVVAKLIAKEPMLLNTLAVQNATRQQTYIKQVQAASSMGVRERVEEKLGYLSTLENAMTHPEGIQIRYTRMDIARMVGASRETVGRVLKDLVKEDQISTDGKTIVLFEEGCCLPAKCFDEPALENAA